MHGRDKIVPLSIKSLINTHYQSRNAIQNIFFFVIIFLRIGTHLPPASETTANKVRERTTKRNIIASTPLESLSVSLTCLIMSDSCRSCRASRHTFGIRQT